jgi:uncharacterized protein (DUF427 family)
VRFDESLHGIGLKAVKEGGMTASNAAHAIEIAPFGGRVRVRFAGEIVADTSHALLLEEGALPPVFYIPRGDVHMDRFEKSAHSSHCPFKGDACYFDVAGGGRREAKAAWSYEHPIPAVAAIAGHLAFYPDKVEIETVPFG